MTATKEPTWLTAKIDQHMARLDASNFNPKDAQGAIVTMLLTEPPDGADKAQIDRWERSCDNCGTYCEPGSSFYTGHTFRDWHGIQVIINFGTCPTCKDLP